MKNNKKASVFIGPLECPNCGNITVHYFNNLSKFHTNIFILFSLPISTKKQTVLCRYCGAERKCTDNEKELYKKAIENGFDDDNIFDAFMLDIKDINKKNNVVVENVVNDANLKSASLETYKKYGIKQGYDLKFYEDLCEICAKESIVKTSKKSMLFRQK